MIFDFDGLIVDTETTIFECWAEFYSDHGETVVRAWIGGEDRTLSRVGKGEYAAAHDDYDVHAMAPDPLPADVRWWIELEFPDGQRLVGSAEPLMD